MRRYTFALLRDYFSARGLTLSRTQVGRKFVYSLTNGVRRDTFVGLSEVRDYATGRSSRDWSREPWSAYLANRDSACL